MRSSPPRAEISVFNPARREVSDRNAATSANRGSAESSIRGALSSSSRPAGTALQAAALIADELGQPAQARDRRQHVDLVHAPRRVQRDQMAERLALRDRRIPDVRLLDGEIAEAVENRPSRDTSRCPSTGGGGGRESHRRRHRWRHARPPADSPRARPAPCGCPSGPTAARGRRFCAPPRSLRSGRRGRYAARSCALSGAYRLVVFDGSYTVWARKGAQPALADSAAYPSGSMELTASTATVTPPRRTITGRRAAARSAPAPQIAMPDPAAKRRVSSECLVAVIQAVIAGEGHDGDAGGARSRRHARRGAHRQPGVRDPGAAPGDGGLQLRDAQVGAAQGRGTAREHRRRIRALHAHIAAGQDGDHAARAMAAPGWKNIRRM